MTLKVLEGIVSHQPFRVLRTVEWSECDPGGGVFAANFYGYALWAWTSMLAHLVEGEGIEVWSPMKSAALAHHATLQPGDELYLEVRPLRVGNTSFEVQVEGMSKERPTFDAVLRMVCTDKAVTHTVPIPKRLKEKLRDRIAATTEGREEK